ncbi:MAG: LacI family DNA-binding transcriptional regulator [Paracoccaceae bacterium]|nr:LacI family DNA-binding transcriptional regulator [Paracoccaceae bacterium]
MSKATIPDIARRAGLSTATVDRALNGRRGVSAANRHRVLKAAEELGVLPSEGMVRLPSRPAHLVFLIPFGENSFMRDLARSITNLSTGLPLVASCNIVTMDGIGPDALERAIDAVSSRTHGVGIITTDHPRSRAAIGRLCDSGVRVVTIASDLPGTPRSSYVGVDNRTAGRTAGQLMGMLARGRTGKIAVILGSRRFHGHSERERGFREYARAHLPSLAALPVIETGEDNRRSNAATLDLLRRLPDLVGIYCVGASRTGVVEAVEEVCAERPSLIMHDLTDSSRDWLKRGLVDVVIDQNPRLVGEQAVIHLLGSIAARTPLLSLKPIEPRIILRENIPAGAP